MFRLKIALLTLVVTGVQWVACTPDAEAGLLRDWLRRCRRPFVAQQPIQVASASVAGLQPGQCATTCQQTCSRVVVNYVPCTSYRTSYERVPVTQYRPQTSSDPCTGCTVTCMRPCTTYTYRMKRVPYTTYRPVYRTESYRVPVTTITNNCDTCSAQPTCATCATGAAAPTVITNAQPIQGFQGQGFQGSITTDGSYGLQPGTTTLQDGTTIRGPLPTPADSTPSINPQNSNRSVIDALGGSSTRIQQPQPQASSWTLTSTDSVGSARSAKNNDIGNTTNTDWYTASSRVASASPVTRKWSYTPAKQQSTYVNLEPASKPEVKTVRGSFGPLEDKPVDVQPTKRVDQNVNAGWETVDW